MNPNTGELFRFNEDNRELMEKMQEDMLPTRLIPLTPGQYKTLEPMTPGRRKNNMRNSPCPCKSGKKFKKCCWSNYA
jgi:uncharacterized protein YecA (UPF0149 family)